MLTRCLKNSRRKTQPTPPRIFYNPIGFDPFEVLPLHLHRYADYARFFLHVLYSQRVFKDLDDEFVPLKYPFGQTILGASGSLAPGPRVTWCRENHRRAMSSGTGPNASRDRENPHGWDRTANEPPVAARLVAWTIPTAPEGHRFRCPILSATRCQRRHVLLLAEACP